MMNTKTLPRCILDFRCSAGRQCEATGRKHVRKVPPAAVRASYRGMQQRAGTTRSQMEQIVLMLSVEGCPVQSCGGRKSSHRKNQIGSEAREGQKLWPLHSKAQYHHSNSSGRGEAELKYCRSVHRSHVQSYCQDAISCSRTARYAHALPILRIKTQHPKGPSTQSLALQRPCTLNPKPSLFEYLDS